MSGLPLYGHPCMCDPRVGSPRAVFPRVYVMPSRGLPSCVCDALAWCARVYMVAL